MTDDEIERLIRANSRSAIMLDVADTQTGKSKLGGLPDLAPGLEWPSWKDLPLAFIAQIDLAALPRLPETDCFPAEGVLYFFFDQEQSTWGSNRSDLGSWQVIYAPNVSALAQASPPPGLAADYIYEEKHVAPRIVDSYPSLERLGLDFSSIPDNAFEIIEEIRAQSFGDAPQHQIGGFPSAVQGDDMEISSHMLSNGMDESDLNYLDEGDQQAFLAGANDWLLLLQVDSDNDTGMMWGDCGRLYFWICRHDLARGDFSKVWMQLQCS